jgi:hypothetical protein
VVVVQKEKRRREKLRARIAKPGVHEKEEEKRTTKRKRRGSAREDTCNDK